MKLTQGMVLRVLINRFHPEGVESLSPFLGEDALRLLEGETLEFNRPDELLNAHHRLLSKIHYSWLVPAIQKLNGPLQAHVIAQMPEPSRSKLAQHFQIAELPERLHPFLREVLVHKVISRLGEESHIHPQLVESGTFSDLEPLTKHQLLDVIDCLGVHDIALEIKQIVDKRKLAKVIETLTPLQKAFLKSAVHERAVWNSTPVGLENWAGDRKNLLRTLHKRGIARFGIALQGADPEFRRLILLKLDTGRAGRLEQVFEEQHPEKAVQTCEKQLRKAIEFVTREAS